MLKRTNRPRQTAAEAYATARSDIARLLERLDAELARHEKRAAANPRDWGLQGDLLKVRADLLETTAFISGLEQDTIEGTLDTTTEAHR